MPQQETPTWVKRIFNWDVLIILFTGYMGGHYFRYKNWKRGFLYFFTVGLILFGWVYDIYRVFAGRQDEFRKRGSRVKIPKLERILPEAAIAVIQNGGLPSIAQTPLVMTGDEQCVFMENAYTSQTRTVTTGYKTTSAGFATQSGQRTVIGGQKGTIEAVRKTVTYTFPGTLYLTTKRFIYQSRDFSLDKKLAQLTSIQADGDHLVVQAGTQIHDIYLHNADLLMTGFHRMREQQTV